MIRSLSIVSDTVCPWCFIGKPRLERALARLPGGANIPIQWRPFQLNPEMPKQGMERAVYLQQKFGEASGGSMYDAVRDAGESVGIAFDFDAIKRQPNSLDSHRLIDWAGRSGKQDSVVTALFEAYFLNGKDIGDREVLAAIAESCGLPYEDVLRYLLSDADIERIQSEDLSARTAGIQGVPCFIVNERYAIQGAQEPEVLLQVFQQIMEEASQGSDDP